MPPARKDSPEGDELSRPSTSRSYSPSLAPPVKRAKTSTGGVPPSSFSSKRHSIGGRQARIEEFVDEKELQEGLLVAVMETADEIMKEDEDNGKEKIEIDKEVISAAARIVWDAMAEDWATDLIAYSRHAGRETIREDDVKLIMRRNPDMLAQILAECEGDEDGEGAAKRRSTVGLQPSQSQKEPREEETEIFDDFITPLRTTSMTSMTSVVPETPQGIAPLAHSTPMNGRSVSMRMARRGNPDFSIPSPIREEGERREGKRVNRSIMNDLSNEAMGGISTQEMDEDFTPMVVDLRHPREQEDEARRMMEEAEGMSMLSQTYQLPGPSTHHHDHSRVESPELFDDGEDKKSDKAADYDSFDDDYMPEDDRNTNGGRNADVTHIMSESAAIREMLDGREDDEIERTTVIEKKEEKDSFDDDDSIQFVEVKKDEKKVAPLNGPSTSGMNTTGILAGLIRPLPTSAVAATSIISQMSSQDSFFTDDIVEGDPLKPPTISVPPPATVPIVTQPPPPRQSATDVITARQPVRADDYDSFDDDDDDFVVPTPNPSKENIPKAIKGPSPKNTVANRWSTVEVEEVVSPATQKKGANNRGVFAEDIFGLNDATSTSKSTPINKPSPTVPSRPSPTATSHRNSSPTVHQQPAISQSTVKKTPVNKNVKTPNPGFSPFSFDSPATTTPPTKTPNRGRGGGMRGARGGRGFPRK